MHSLKKVLPTFLVCGAQKSGTTAIYKALQAHPDVCMSKPKETEFFNWRYRRGWRWFSTHFEHYSGETAVGEASSRTMPTPEAPERIAEELPNVRLIFVLRDPVERAHSAFWYYVTQGILCPGGDFGSFIRNEGHPLRQEVIHYGFYDRHLSRFQDQFAESQCLLLRHLDVRTSPEKTMSRICQFIGVDSTERTDLSRESNVTRYPISRPAYAFGRRIWKPVERAMSAFMPTILESVREQGKKWFLESKRPPLSTADRQYLSEIYRPTIDTLSEEFELDLSEWSTCP